MGAERGLDFHIASIDSIIVKMKMGGGRGDFHYNVTSKQQGGGGLGNN
jgi:hypothetical protein